VQVPRKQKLVAGRFVPGPWRTQFWFWRVLIWIQRFPHQAMGRMTGKPWLGGLPHRLRPCRTSLDSEPGPRWAGHPCSAWRLVRFWGQVKLRRFPGARAGKGLGAASGRRAVGGHGWLATIAGCCGVHATRLGGDPLPAHLPRVPGALAGLRFWRRHPGGALVGAGALLGKRGARLGLTRQDLGLAEVWLSADSPPVLDRPGNLPLREIGPCRWGPSGGPLWWLRPSSLIALAAAGGPLRRRLRPRVAAKGGATAKAAIRSWFGLALHT